MPFRFQSVLKKNKQIINDVYSQSIAANVKIDNVSKVSCFSAFSGCAVFFPNPNMLSAIFDMDEKSSNKIYEIVSCNYLFQSVP